MNPGGCDGGFERQLERELARRARRLRAPSPNPSQSAYHRFARSGGARPWLSAAASTSTKVAAGLVAACLLGAGGAVAAIAGTGSPNPVVWGHTVARAVAPVPGQATPEGRAAPAMPAAPTAGPATGSPPTGSWSIPAVSPMPAAHPTGDPDNDPNPSVSGDPTHGTSGDANSPGSGRPSPLPAIATGGGDDPVRTGREGGATGTPETAPAGSSSAHPGASPSASPDGPAVRPSFRP